MKLYCRISGLPVLTTPAFGRLWKEYTTEHPVFKLSSKRLWQLVESSAGSDLQWLKLTGDEKRLLFLAVLNSTGLVQWHTSAKVTVSFAEQHFPRLLKFATWKLHLLRPTKFPQLKVSAENEKLESLPAWLDECLEIQAGELKSLTKREKEHKQALVDEKFSLLQKQARLSKHAKTRYLNKLVDWMLETAQVPDKEITVESGSKKELNLRDLIRKIMLTPDDEVGHVHPDDIEYLQEYFSIKLPAGSISSFAVQERFKELEDLKQKELNTFELLDMLLLNTDTDASNSTDTEAEVGAANTADVAPQREQYATDFAFNVAMKAWLKRTQHPFLK